MIFCGLPLIAPTKIRSTSRRTSYIEGKNLVVVWRLSDEKAEHLATTAQELPDARRITPNSHWESPTAASPIEHETLPVAWYGVP